MGEFFLLFSITFISFVGFAWLFMFCKRKKAQTQNDLSGTCHSSGGGTCSSCSGELTGAAPKEKLQTEIGPMVD
jgi:hypothetical protein